MTGEDATRRLFIAIQEFRNEEVSTLLDADPALLDATYRGHSVAASAVAAHNFAALLIMCDVLERTPSCGVTSDEPRRPSSSRFFRIASGLGDWTEAEKKWLDDNPKAVEHELLLRAAIQEAREEKYRPNPARMIEVVSGLSQWTEEEIAWLKKHPNWMKHEEDLRATLREVEGKPPETAEEHLNRLLTKRQKDPPSPN